MTHSRFVRPETRTIKISDGDSITVKRRLNTGEQRALMAMVRERDEQGRSRADITKVNLGLVLAYLVDWTLCDDHGTKVEIFGKNQDDVQSAVDMLDEESFDEIRLAIDKHIVEMDAERKAAKNGQSGESASQQTSPSPDAAVGATSGSSN